jgi:hypothetical protein
MSTPIIHGTEAPIPRPVETSWSRRGGWEFIHSWTGAADAVRAMEAALRANGAIQVVVRQNPDSALATITAHYASAQTGEPEEMEETLDIDFADETFPINVNPAFINITDARIAVLDEKGADSKVDIDTYTSDPTERYYMRLVRRKETSYRVDLPVLTYIRNVPETSVSRINCGNNGLIYTPAEVADAIAAPIVFTIPSANVGIAAGSRYVIGYKFKGRVEFTSNGRVNLIERYVFGRYDAVLYTGEAIA